MAYHGPGMNIMDPNISYGLNRIRRNPKKKGRLPYHARRRHLDLAVMLGNGPRKCDHALAHHELVTDQNNRLITVSYALPCTVAHKATTKSPTHKDSAKGSWK
jgi:hypothetical protein